MSVIIESGRFTSPASSTPQYQTVSLNRFGGKSPKAVLAMTCGSYASWDSHSRLGIGAGDGVYTASATLTDRDNVGTTYSKRSQGTLDFAILPSITTGATNEGASITSFAADEFTLWWGPIHSSGVPYEFMAFGGDDLNARALQTGSKGSTGLQTIYPGFKPDAVIFFISGNVSNNSYDDHVLFSTGFAARNSGQWATGTCSRGNVSTSRTSRGLANGKCIYVPWDEAVWMSAMVDSWGDNNFVLNWVVHPTTSRRIGMLVLGGGQYWAGPLTEKGSAGDQAITSPGFRPVGVMAHFNGKDASGVYGDSLVHSFGFSDGEAGRNILNHAKDGQTTSNTFRRQSGGKLLYWYNDSATYVDASLKSFDAAGLTLNYSVSTGSRLIGLLAIGDVASVNLTAGMGDGSAEALGCTSAIGRSFTASVGDASCEGLGGGVALGASLAAGIGDAHGEGLNCSAAIGTALAAGDGDAAGTGLSCTAAIGAKLTAAPGDGSGEGLAATVETGGQAVALTAGIGDGVGAGLAAATAVGASLRGSVGDASCEGLGATSAAGASVGTGIGEGTAAGQAASARAGAAFSVGTGAGSGGELSVTAAIGDAFTVGVSDAVAAGLAATVAIGARLAAGISEGFGVGLTTSMDSGAVEPYLVDAMHYSSAGVEIARGADCVATMQAAQRVAIMRSTLQLGAAK